MRLNLTNHEAKCLKETLDGVIADRHGSSGLLIVLKGIADKVGAGIVGQQERDEFRVGNVVCERKRGSEFKGYDRRTTSSTKFGWLLTHEPTGRTEEIPPDRGSGISKQAIALFAETFAKTCDRAARLTGGVQ
jgi:hypothetical protein